MFSIWKDGEEYVVSGTPSDGWTVTKFRGTFPDVSYKVDMKGSGWNCNCPYGSRHGFMRVNDPSYPPCKHIQIVSEYEASGGWNRWALWRDEKILRMLQEGVSLELVLDRVEMLNQSTNPFREEKSVQITLTRSGVPCVTVRRIDVNAIAVHEGQDRRVVRASPSIIPQWMILYSESDVDHALQALANLSAETVGIANVCTVDRPLGLIKSKTPQPMNKKKEVLLRRKPMEGDRVRVKHGETVLGYGRILEIYGKGRDEIIKVRLDGSAQTTSYFLAEQLEIIREDTKNGKPVSAKPQKFGRHEGRADWDSVQLGDTVDLEFADGWESGSVASKSPTSMDIINNSGRWTANRSDVLSILRIGSNAMQFWPDKAKDFRPGNSKQVFVRFPIGEDDRPGRGLPVPEDKRL